MVHNNTETIYYRRYSTIEGHYNTEGTVQHGDNILQKVQYNTEKIYYRRSVQ